MAKIHFIGGEKGGVGKSVLARVLAQYYIDKSLNFRAFDADLSHGALMRYYGEFTQPVDVSEFESADAVAETALEQNCDVIVDLAAQSARSVDRWMAESGLLEFANEAGLSVVLWHVCDEGSDSVRLLERLVAHYGDQPNYVVVKNLGRGKDFDLLEESEAMAKARSFGATVIELPELHTPAMRKIDRVGASLWAAANNKDESMGPALGLLERQRVRVWLNKAYAELERVV
ncbi:mobilization protein [Teredinibacter turnerae]|uniref:mobilization protein n=1 Tax=Teredinibacter turnerae TaxID=2426 RepID=UPI00035FAE43|nr:mobilization protein [Teredinibacter turnerae]